jgi:hypothetical protein
MTDNFLEDIPMSWWHLKEPSALVCRRTQSAPNNERITIGDPVINEKMDDEDDSDNGYDDEMMMKATINDSENDYMTMTMVTMSWAQSR